MKIAATFLFAIALATPAVAEELAPVALNSLTAAPAKITSAPVLDQTGKVIGRVRAIVTDQDGRPAAFSYVSTADKRLRVVAAPAASYDGHRNIVIADIGQHAGDDQVAVN